MPRFRVLHGTVSGKGPGSIVDLPASMASFKDVLELVPDEEPKAEPPAPVPPVVLPEPVVIAEPAVVVPHRKKGKHS